MQAKSSEGGGLALSARIPEPKEIDLVLYRAHSTDGFTAAWAAWRLLKSQADYAPSSHNWKLPNVTDRNVAVLNFNYPKRTFDHLCRQARSLIILDHHRPFSPEIESSQFSIFDVSRCGASIAWSWFHPEETVPEFIRYLEDHELGIGKLVNSKAFTLGLQISSHNFEDYDEISRTNIQELVRRGETLLQYTGKNVYRLLKNAVHVRFRGYRAVVINAMHWVSELGDGLLQIDNADLAIIWFYDHKARVSRVSLRSRKTGPDVAIIAKELGGGGNAQAAGFEFPGHVEELFDDFKSDYE